jgi:hypothetical protein
MRTRFVISSAAMLAAFVLNSQSAAQTADDLTPAEAKSIAQDGYVFGPPLVYTTLQADAVTNVAKRTQASNSRPAKRLIAAPV